ncbi:uncharacterized protein LAJ45_01129 [Morchella importuna]|uniref:uncharacterized protein n=1 Tax=Morchella importuna TaxID=1174673 RepID=UPI001E8DAB86|nr:uncharacterized protein LAJ45_01129 [Morchella importuna]KAH8154601.1 hypothetical protein LAJ45_01129 [Morchella importuna]
MCSFWALYLLLSTDSLFPSTFYENRIQVNNLGYVLRQPVYSSEHLRVSPPPQNYYRESGDYCEAQISGPFPNQPTSSLNRYQNLICYK